jgi:hypothetical protein
MKQISLFSEIELRQVRHSGLDAAQHLEMSADSLQAWKQKIYQFQQHLPQVTESPSLQTQLFSDPPSLDAATIDPFGLPQQNIEFWRWPVDEPGVAALYFVVDHELPLLLYVGETCKANQRWKGVHDCKRYIHHYISAHRRHGLKVQVQIGFWCHAPRETKSRQTLESKLIHQWRSPFNRENWPYWGTPFTWGKLNKGS